MDQDFLSTAIAFLSKDPILKPVIEKFPRPTWSTDTPLYNHLLSAIIGQQLSEKAASTIEKRFLTFFGEEYPPPAKIIETENDAIRACGISFSKINYMKSLADAVISGSLILENIPNLEDEAVIAELTKVKGIGKWTAEMTLIFTLKRPDIFSLGDLGLCTAVSRLYNIPREEKAQIEQIAKTWSPYRSIASRYLWMSLDNQ